MFFLRRFFYVVFPIAFNAESVFQIQFICFCTQLYMIYYAGSRPHTSRGKYRIEIFNDVIFMMMIYHLICFSDFNSSMEARFEMGYSQVSLIGILITVNISSMVFTSCVDMKRARVLKTLEKAKMKRIEESSEILLIHTDYWMSEVKDKVKTDYLK